VLPLFQKNGSNENHCYPTSCFDVCSPGKHYSSVIKNFENYCYAKAKETHDRHMVTPGKTICVKPFSLLQGKANGISAEKEI
jgi:hypothetical protein